MHAHRLMLRETTLCLWGEGRGYSADDTFHCCCAEVRGQHIIEETPKNSSAVNSAVKARILRTTEPL